LESKFWLHIYTQRRGLYFRILVFSVYSGSYRC